MKRQLKIEYTDPQESFSMGGPYLANCYLFDKKLKHRFLVDNYFVSQDGKYLFLNRYTTPKQKKVLGVLTFTEDTRDFRIIACDLSSDCFYISRQGFDHLYIQEIINDTIYFHTEFHADLPEYKSSIPFSDRFFKKHDIDELYEDKR